MAKIISGKIVVEPNDTLWGIYGPNWKQMSQYIGDPRELQPGTELPLPPMASTSSQSPFTPGVMQSTPQPQPAVSGGPQSPVNPYSQVSGRPAFPGMPSSAPVSLGGPQVGTGTANTGMVQSGSEMTGFPPSPPAVVRPTSPWQTVSGQPGFTAPGKAPGFVENILDKVSTPAMASDERSQGYLSSSKPSQLPDYIWDQIVTGAREAEVAYGLPASVTLAQFLLETGGDVNKFIGGTNIFGVKGNGPAGSTQAWTTEVGPDKVEYRTKATFAKYNSIPEAIEAHTQLLLSNPAYKKVQDLIAKGDKNPFNYTQALHGTYATDPIYKQKLDSVIVSRGLTHADKYDGFPAPTPAPQNSKVLGTSSQGDNQNWVTDPNTGLKETPWVIRNQSAADNSKSPWLTPGPSRTPSPAPVAASAGWQTENAKGAFNPMKSNDTPNWASQLGNFLGNIFGGNDKPQLSQTPPGRTMEFTSNGQKKRVAF